MFRLCLFLFALLISAQTALANKRVALVIGNGDYASAPGLDNPKNDALAISQSLERLGFDVISGTDLSHDETRLIVRDFSKAMDDAEIALFFFAGHGIQVDGKNYLIPVDGSFEDGEADLDFSAIDVDFVMRQMERSAKTRILLLDACRNNPFEIQLSDAMGQSRSARALGKGLAAMDNEGGALMAFATRPGEVAFDGDGTHSPFTKALLQHIEEPGLEINRIMTRVRRDVNAATQGRQLPWTSSVLLQDVFLSQPRSEPVVVDPTQQDLEAWQRISNSTNAADFAKYLNDFPQGLFSELARKRITDLDTAPVVATLAPALPQFRDQGGQQLNATRPSQTDEDISFGTAPQLPNLSADALEGGNVVKLVQSELDRLGCAPGGADGKWGRNSARALERFRDAKGTNELFPSEPTLALLNVLRAETKTVCETVAVQKPATPSAPKVRKTKRKRNCFSFNGATVCE